LQADTLPRSIHLRRKIQCGFALALGEDVGLCKHGSCVCRVKVGHALRRLERRLRTIAGPRLATTDPVVHNRHLCHLGAVDAARIGEDDAAAGQMLGPGDHALEPPQLPGAGKTFRVEGAAIGDDGIGLAHALQRRRAFERRHAVECHLRKIRREPRHIGLRIGANDEDIGRHASTLARARGAGWKHRRRPLRRLIS
jgi:hypothetical protein